MPGTSVPGIRLVLRTLNRGDLRGAMWDALWVNASLATMAGPNCALVPEGAVGVHRGVIAWIGCTRELPDDRTQVARSVFDVGGRVVTPGLIDCHTHLVYAGTRWREFEMRIGGATRAEIAEAGGGIAGTVRETRASSFDDLLSQSIARAKRMLAAGVTTVESKSGYGLDLETELRMMRVSREIGRILPLTVRSTFLGAHGLAPEYAGRPDDYINFLCSEVLPAAVRENLVDAVDGFCDVGGFTHAQIERLFRAATNRGLPVKLHADQHSDFGATSIVVQFRGLSADHVDHASAPAIKAMAETGTVATLLPGANWTLSSRRKPPVNLFRSYGVPIALATNCNPGTSPTTSPTMMMNMACQLFGMSPDEALAGFTRVAAQALGLAASRGTLETGKAADLAIWDVVHPSELSYFIGDNRCMAVVKDGRLVYSRPEIAFEMPH